MLLCDRKVPKLLLTEGSALGCLDHIQTDLCQFLNIKHLTVPLVSHHQSRKIRKVGKVPIQIQFLLRVILGYTQYFPRVLYRLRTVNDLIKAVMAYQVFFRQFHQLIVVIHMVITVIIGVNIFKDNRRLLPGFVCIESIVSRIRPGHVVQDDRLIIQVFQNIV